MLVVDRHALVAVDPLDLFDQVHLRLADALDLHELLRVGRTVGDQVAGLDVLTVLDDRTGTEREQRLVLLTGVVDDRDRDALALVLAESQHTGGLGQTGRALRGASLEQLDDARQTAGDVLAGHTTGVEGPHGQLRTGLTDRLGGDDADGLAEFDRLAGGQRTAVAQRAHAEFGVAREHRADTDPLDGLVVAKRHELVVADDRVALDDRAVGQRDVVQQRTAEQLRLEVACACWRCPGATFGIQTPSVVPQSSSRTISSWATSTRRRVR